MRIPAGTVALVGLVLVSGCFGGGSAPAATTTSPHSHDGPQTTSTRTTPVDESAVIAYRDLSPTDQRFVRQLLDNGSMRVPPPMPDQLYPLDEFDYDYIRYRGALYSITGRCNGLVGKHTISDVRAVNESSVGEEFDRVSFRNLSSRARTVFERALHRSADTDARAYWTANFPDTLSPGTVVEYQGTTYRIWIQAADLVGCTYEIDPLGGPTTTTQDPPPTNTTQPPTSRTITTSSPPTPILIVQETSENISSVPARARSTFENLSERKQDEFVQALRNNGTLNDVSAWSHPADPTAVKYNGSWYQVYVVIE